ncbi:membrane protein required for colicin V production [Limimonas halophila]|uniref:Membrane protein required for colicin V production n=1 Tax=Limimonas halophila TaxID=1082479 RepID=A0A1G7MDH1_9PROT|nr:CvpA family protein [Limimonas halophila]SDF59878.1 membrane protein required for colicin V production [Limimonas halophila]
MSDLPINAVDVVVLAVLLVSAVLAFLRGFVHEVLGIGAWVGAALATLYGFPHAQPYARDLIAIDLVADIVAGVAIFLVVLIVLAVISRMLGARVQQSSLGALDRSLGLAFGLVRGAVILAAAWLVMEWAVPDPADRPSWVQDAESRKLVEFGAHTMAGLLPPSWTASGAAAVDSARDTADRARQAKDAYDALAQPDVKPDTSGETGGQGYKDETREQLESIIQQQTGTGGSEQQ